MVAESVGRVGGESIKVGFVVGSGQKFNVRPKIQGWMEMSVWFGGESKTPRNLRSSGEEGGRGRGAVGLEVEVGTSVLNFGGGVGA